MQGFLAQLQTVLHQHSRAVLRLDEAVAARRSAESRQEQAYAQTLLGLAEPKSCGASPMSLLELAAHTHSLRVGSAALPGHLRFQGRG